MVPDAEADRCASGKTSQFRARSLDEAVELAKQESAEYAREDGLDIIVGR
ncbi:MULTISPECIES: hypothetical protein [Streptomyces]|uniref:Uncharacterized protein n=2 Tax=Streptomyces TaxID=1883 RepID=A0ABU4KJN0_9ACTN|nr:hypothetical protein [Streptomyces roseolus]MDX2297512.1 hypothetical protein [Streptomyces roseolus]